MKMETKDQKNSYGEILYNTGWKRALVICIGTYISSSIFSTAVNLYADVQFSWSVEKFCDEDISYINF